MKYKPSIKHKSLLEDASAQIIKIEAKENYTLFFHQNGKTNLMAYTLKNYQEHFDYPFVRVNRSCIVNLFYFSNFCFQNKKLLLTDGSEILISRRRLESVLEKISLNL
jgi:DNA-binding LytR/AlgR family response regulator